MRGVWIWQSISRPVQQVVGDDEVFVEAEAKSNLCDEPANSLGECAQTDWSDRSSDAMIRTTVRVGIEGVEASLSHEKPRVDKVRREGRGEFRSTGCWQGEYFVNGGVMRFGVTKELIRCVSRTCSREEPDTAGLIGGKPIKFQASDVLGSLGSP